ncbi:MAG: glutamate--tRNA ligase family protein [archaeon]
MKKWKDLIYAYALKNALSHEGKAVEGAVISALFNEGLKKDGVKTVIPDVKAAIKNVNSMTNEAQEKEFNKVKGKVSEREVREGLPELPNVPKSGVVMRIAPSPSGPLHLMHAINTSLNFLYVEKYKGKLYVRIEDTNPENVYKPAYKMIKDEAGWLTDNKGIIQIQSDNIPIYYKYVEKMIRSGDVYVCTCSAESFKELAEQKKACPCRKLDVKKNLERWKKMLSKGGYKAGEAVVRFKSNIKDPNPAMRDFPLARVNETPHPLKKTQYRVWPLMNLAVTVDDIESKMTHVIRGKDHRDNAARQGLIYKALGKKPPWTAFTGMTNFIGMRFSTRQMRKDIEDGKYKGWDDPRLPTVASLRKRGYTPEAFRKLAERTGNLSEVDKVIKKEDFFELLDSFK